MKAKRIVRKIMGLVVVAAIAYACATNDPEFSRGIEINNDQAALSARMTDKNEAITIVSSDAGKVAMDLKLTLKAELEPPKVGGQLLQATSIYESKGGFVVSYNFAGDAYHGGIDLIDNKVRLKSEIQFKDADVNDITILGNDVFFVGGTSSLETSAFVEKVSIRKGVFSLDGNIREGVGSYTANSITNSESVLYVSSGNDEASGGGVYAFDENLTQKGFSGVQDARWVMEADGVVYCLSGNPSLIRTFNSALDGRGKFEHKAFSSAESKMTIDVDEELIFVAGGEQGLLVYDLEGNLQSQYSFDENSVTNAVTAEDGTVFVSNGEGGVHVASYEDKEIKIIGKLELNSDESVNHILLKGKKLYVASGLGGVKLIQLK